MLDTTLITITIFALGMIIGAVALWFHHRYRLGSYELISRNIITQAEQRASLLAKEQEFACKQQQLEHQHMLERREQEQRGKWNREEERFKQREDKLEARFQLFDKKFAETEKREQLLSTQQRLLEQAERHAKEQGETLRAELEKIAGITASDAKKLLQEQVRKEVVLETENYIRRCRKEAEEEVDREAKRLLATAINRLAVVSVSEATVNTVSIPNNEMKGRIIGKEGRNIRALEQITGVTFVIDDVPGVVVLSCFDPLRLQVAKIALTELLSDGRIYPSRIEEVVEKAQQQIKKDLKRYGEDAALRLGISDLHPELITLLGKLKLRFSYGQNLLDHSVEVAHLMGLMASELELDVARARRIGLLHDIGKAVSHEISGSHAIVGRDLAIKYGESVEVANGIGCHHHEVEPISIEGALCYAADAISASRPGARIEAVEEYVKRLTKLEEIAGQYPGVEKAYALQAGRELLVTVFPDQVEDQGLLHLARDITKRIEAEARYSGKIKVVVSREKRIIQYAT